VRERPATPLVVFGHQIGALLAPLVAARRGRPRLIVRCLNNLAAQEAGGGLGGAGKRLGLRLLLPRVPLLVAQSRTMARDLQRRWGVPRRRLAVLPNPVPAWARPPAPRPTPKWDLAWIGRLEPQKDPLWLVDGLAELARRGRRPRTIVLGEGTLRPALEGRIAEAGLGDMVELAGFRDDVPEILARTHAVVLTSHYEGFPNVLLEALALGLPVVAADCPTGPRELVAGERHGALVRRRDPAALANAIERVLDRDWDPRALAGSVAGHRAEAVVARWQALLSAVPGRA